jgi:hypothetical protein
MNLNEVINTINFVESEQDLLLALIKALCDDDMNKIDGAFYDGLAIEIGIAAKQKMELIMKTKSKGKVKPPKKC